MQFRYKLAKETFKGKKIPPKKAPGADSISPDQRGDHTWSDSQLLSMDQQAKRPPKPAEPKEMSRRDLFSFGRLTDFADAVEEEEKKLPKKKKPVEETDAPTAEEDTVATTAGEVTVSESGEKKGFFKRIVHRFRRSGKKDPQESEVTEIEVESTRTEIATESETRVETSRTVTEKTVRSAPATGTTGKTNNPFQLTELEEQEADPEYSRRNLLRQGVHFFAKPAINRVQDKIDRVNETVDKITKRVPLIRPPGAISEKQFLQACTRCDKCVHACPKDAIQIAPRKLGFLIAGTPYIDPKKIPCVMCDDLPCIPACPDGALVMPESRSRMDVKMGYAILDKAKCQAYGDGFCQQCVIDCPIPGAINQVNDRPVIDKNVCTGCGVCVLSCSTVNIPVAIKIKPQMVIESQIRAKMLEKEKARIQAEREAAAKQAKETEEEEIEDTETA